MSKKTEKENRPVDEQEKKDAVQDTETQKPDDDSQETGNPSPDEKDGMETATTQNPPSDENDGDNAASQNPSCKKKKLVVRHKSILPNYYRAGLRFTKKFAEYEVPCDRVDTIKNDVWLEVKETK